MTNSAAIVFPHQLFEQNPLFEKAKKYFLVEEELFFRQYNFHKQKILFHRASMKFYSDFLQEKGLEVKYIESTVEESDIRKLIPLIKKQGFEKLFYLDVTDNWLEKRIRIVSKKQGLKLEVIESPLFVND